MLGGNGAVVPPLPLSLTLFLTSATPRLRATNWRFAPATRLSHLALSLHDARLAIRIEFAAAVGIAEPDTLVLVVRRRVFPLQACPSRHPTRSIRVYIPSRCFIPLIPPAHFLHTRPPLAAHWHSAKSRRLAPRGHSFPVQVLAAGYPPDALHARMYVHTRVFETELYRDVKPP